MSILFSPDFDDYAAGRKSVSEIRCVLCMNVPCICPPFGTEAYFVLTDFRHGKISADDPKFRKYFRIGGKA
jgi:hypothetical protein